MKLILFDIDGTLIRSHGVGRRAFGAAVESVLSCPGVFDGYCFGGLTDPIIVRHVLTTAGVPQAEHDEVTDALYKSYLANLEAGLAETTAFEVLPGALRLIERLLATGDHALALGTGNIEAGARLKLRRGNLDHYFPTGGFGSDASDRSEVLAAGLRKAEAHYGTTFDRVWVVGDTTRDIEAARGIGANVVGVATGSNTTAELQAVRPDHVCDTLDSPIVDRLLLDPKR